MKQSKIRPSSLVERLDILADHYGRSLAQTFIASGEPTDAPLELNFAAFVAEVRRRSNALGALGIGSDDVVAFAAPLAEKSYPTLVAAMVSATLAPVNFFLEADALTRVIQSSGARALLIHRSFDDGADILERLKSVGKALPHLKLLSFGDGSMVEGVHDIESVVGVQPSTSWNRPTRNRSPDRVVALFHTGGTTGLPKLVPHTEAMYDAMIASCGAGEGTEPGESILCGVPLFHTSGVLQAGLVPLFNATRLIIPSSRGFRDPKAIANYWRFVRRFGITIGASVPTVLAALSGIEPDGPITSLKRILVGGAPLARATIARIVEKTGGAEVIEGWGMTETCGFSVLNPHGRTKVGSVGLPFPGVEMQIRRFGPGDVRGEGLGTNETGELVVRGDIVIKSYLDERPGAFSDDGWLRTGDLGRIDADGYLWLTGRLKDIIIRGGHNIDPSIIEEPAYQHPAVQLAAAIGKPDKYAGELPVLYVQLKSDANTSEEELVGFVRERILERAAVPKSVIIVPEIPLSGPGKISKLLLRRLAIAGVFQEELDRLAFSDADIRATVEEDRLAGDVVVLSGGSTLDPERRERVAAALGGFAIQFHWADGSGVADDEAPVHAVELRS